VSAFLTGNARAAWQGGTAEEMTEIVQFAWDYDWSATQPIIEDPEYAAWEIVDRMHLDAPGMSLEMLEILREELVSSAWRENEWRKS
jgi:hypothetical protein